LPFLSGQILSLTAVGAVCVHRTRRHFWYNKCPPRGLGRPKCARTGQTGGARDWAGTTDRPGFSGRGLPRPACVTGNGFVGAVSSGPSEVRVCPRPAPQPQYRGGKREGKAWSAGPILLAGSMVSDESARERDVRHRSPELTAPRACDRGGGLTEPGRRRTMGRGIRHCGGHSKHVLEK